MGQAFISGAVAIGVPLAFALLAKLFPSTQARGMSPEERAALAKRYVWLNIAGLPFFFGFVALFTWLWTLTWLWIANASFARLPPAAYVIKSEPLWGAMMLPSLFLGIISACLPMDLLMRLVLRDRYADYLRAEEARVGFNLKKISIGFVVIVPFLASLVGLSLIDWYALVDEQGITINRLLSLQERRYAYDDIDKLAVTSHLTAPNGNVLERTRWTIVFRDGTRFCNEDFMQKENGKPNFELFRFVSDRSGKPIQSAKFIDDILR